MSFSPIVQGLNQTGHPGADATLDGMAFTTMFPCLRPLPGGGSFVIYCDACDDGASAFTVDLATIPYNSAADYYAVRLILYGPKLGGGSVNCKEGALPTESPCEGVDSAFYDGVVSGGPYVTFGAQPVTPTYSAHGSLETAGTCRVDWPDQLSPACWIVNTAPVWPVDDPGAPDAAGNQFGGLCLFTLAQLAAIAPITTTITHHNHDQITAGRLAVAVLEYEIGETVAPLRSSWITGAI